MTKKEKFIFISVMAVPLLLLFGWIFLNFITDKRTGKEIYINSEINVECIGKVDSIYRLEMNHNTLSLKVNKSNFYVPAEWENKFKIGDSISKRKGELVLEHYRDDKLIELLDYQKLNRR